MPTASQVGWARANHLHSFARIRHDQLAGKTPNQSRPSAGPSGNGLDFKASALLRATRLDANRRKSEPLHGGPTFVVR